MYLRILYEIPFDKRTTAENVWKPLAWRKILENITQILM